MNAGKYAEAQQLTAVLLVAYPDDQRLIKAKALLDKLLAPAAPTNRGPDMNQPANSVATPQPAANTNAEQLTGMEKVDYRAPSSNWRGRRNRPSTWHGGSNIPLNLRSKLEPEVKALLQARFPHINLVINTPDAGEPALRVTINAYDTNWNHSCGLFSCDVFVNSQILILFFSYRPER